MVGGTCRGAAVFFHCIFSGGRPDTWADTTTPHGRLMLTVLGGLAEFERELWRDHVHSFFHDNPRIRQVGRGVRQTKSQKRYDCRLACRWRR
jgi:DNA invertase Pin-like site-specific DNA recombinase